MQPPLRGGVKKKLSRRALSAGSRRMGRNVPGKGRKEVFQWKKHEVSCAVSGGRYEVLHACVKLG